MAIGAQLGDAYPRLTEMQQEHVLTGEYDYFDEFDYGLELMVNALDGRLTELKA